MSSLYVLELSVDSILKLKVNYFLYLIILIRQSSTSKYKTLCHPNQYPKKNHTKCVRKKINYKQSTKNK